MSRSGEITLPFGTEERVFRLGYREWEKLDETLDCGPGELLQRLAPMVRAVQAGLTLPEMLIAGTMGTWRARDPREVILQGLLGGGMTSTEAGILVRQQFEENMAWKLVPLAFDIIQASWSGVASEPMGEKKAAKPKRQSRPSRAAKSASPPSTAPGL